MIELDLMLDRSTGTPHIPATCSSEQKPKSAQLMSETHGIGSHCHIDTFRFNNIQSNGIGHNLMPIGIVVSDVPQYFL